VDPNIKFAGIAEIRATQTEARRDLDKFSETTSSSESETEDCIKLRAETEEI